MGRCRNDDLRCSCVSVISTKSWEKAKEEGIICRILYIWANGKDCEERLDDLYLPAHTTVEAGPYSYGVHVQVWVPGN